MIKDEIELLHNMIITADQLEEIELSECVECIADLGQSVFHDAEWYSVRFTDGSDIDVYVLEEEHEIDCELNLEKVEELLKMGDIFQELNGIFDWSYINNDKIEIYTSEGTYLSERVHGTWGRLIRSNAFTM